MKKDYFENLDALRFLAFLGVFFYHHNYLFNVTFDPAPHEGMLFDQGENAVSFFFVLSGFLISYLLLTEKRKEGTIKIGTFFMKRVLRIIPLYIIILTLGFMLIPWFSELITGIQPQINEHISWYLFFGANLDQVYLLSNELANSRVLGVLWSIAVEEQFYLIWPFLIFLIPNKWLPALFALLIAASLVFKFVYRHEEWVLSYHSFSVMSDLVLGGTIAWLYLFSNKFVQFFENLPKWVIFSSYLFGFSCIVLNQYFPIIERYRILLPLFWAFIILEQCVSKNSIIKLSQWKRMSQLGKISYGSYMYHCVIMIVVNLIVFRQYDLVAELDIIETMGIVVLNLTATLFVSYISYRYFESYFLRLKHKLKQTN